MSCSTRLSMMVWMLTCSATLAAEPVLQVATIRVDVTPPVGDGPCVGCMPKVTSVEHPLELRGVVLQADSRVFVIAAIDFCGICNTSDETIRDAMARAAGTTRERVALQSIHQHSAPILDADAVRLLHGEPFVEFQLFAQQSAPQSSFVCVAGYGECGVWYYGPDRIYTDRGGYEQTWSVTGPCQPKVEAALRSLVGRKVVTKIPSQTN